MKDAVILITRNGMGSADEKLQLMLIAKYLELLLHNGNLPSAICFYTDGVRLVCEGSPVIEQLQKLESSGVRLIVCSTCLNYFGLQDKVRVGIVGGMGDILEAQTKAEKVISIYICPRQCCQQHLQKEIHPFSGIYWPESSLSSCSPWER